MTNNKLSPKTYLQQFQELEDGVLLLNKDYIKNNFLFPAIFLKEKSHFPYIYKADNILVCGTRHRSDPMHFQMGYIQKAIEQFKPDIILTEGAIQLRESVRNIGKKYLKEVIHDRLVQTGDLNSIIKQYHEFGIGYKYSYDNNIPITSWEPTFLASYKFILSQGFTIEDFFEYLVYRGILIYARRKIGFEKHIQYLNNYLLRYWNFKLKYLNFDFSIVNFIRIYNQNNQTSFTESDFVDSPELFKGSKNYPKINNLFLFFRDKSLIRISKLKANQYKRVFVIAGVGHILMTEEKLRTLNSKTLTN